MDKKSNPTKISIPQNIGQRSATTCVESICLARYGPALVLQLNSARLCRNVFTWSRERWNG